MTDAPAAAPEAAPVAAAETTAPAEAPKPSGKSPFEIKKWSPVFMWSWDVESDTCSICRGNLNELCLECQTKPTNGECTIAWGVCNVCLNFSFSHLFSLSQTQPLMSFDVFVCVFFFFLQQHAFHFHCISQWLKQRKNCPLGLFLLLHMCFFMCFTTPHRQHRVGVPEGVQVRHSRTHVRFSPLFCVFVPFVFLSCLTD